MTKKHVVIGMSGGVDSSVAAFLLKKAGFQVTGLFMKNWEDDDNETYCSSRQDWLDAVSVADMIGIDIETVNFSKEYKEHVFALFLDEYQQGRTPNPDVLCNAEIKFKAFLKYAMGMGAQYIATGHYARVKKEQDRFQLLKALDLNKDQSYFLHKLNQYQLSKTLFPLGELTKIQVREMANQIGLHNAIKKDSTGICFIGERPFRDFLNRYLAKQAGPIKTPENETLGEHIGLSFYTLGQRKGIGIGGIKNHQDTNGTHQAWYVAKKDIEHNTLYVVQGHDHPWLLSHTLEATQAHWVRGSPPNVLSLTAKTRYRQQDVPCTLILQDHDRFTLHFDKAQWAITPGQFAVLYHENVCLGGGVIDNTTPQNRAIDN